ncbi:hypothetical protein AAG570_005365 [Ranatra chinensis]|uniref:Uncharacterized protein n=1 Tax=Ranatra chinensis TaxID=642074 RepID=A0ABD0Y096_9HEMI
MRVNLNRSVSLLDGNARPRDSEHACVLWMGYVNVFDCRLRKTDCSASTADSFDSSSLDIEKILNVAKRLPPDVPSSVLVNELYKADTCVPSDSEIVSILKQYPRNVSPRVVLDELYKAGKSSTGTREVATRFKTPEVAKLRKSTALHPMDEDLSQNSFLAPLSDSSIVTAQFHICFNIQIPGLETTTVSEVFTTSLPLVSTSPKSSEPLNVSDHAEQNADTKMKGTHKTQVPNEQRREARSPKLPKTGAVGSLKYESNPKADNCPVILVTKNVTFEDCVVGKKSEGSIELYNNSQKPTKVKLVHLPQGFSITQGGPTEYMIGAGQVMRLPLQLQASKLCPYLGTCRFMLDGYSPLCCTLMGRGVKQGKQ